MWRIAISGISNDMRPVRLFKVISTGQTVDDRDQAALVQKIAELTKQDVDSIPRLIDGGDNALMGGMNYVQAVKAKDAFQIAGLICRIEAEAEYAENKEDRPLLLGGHAFENVINPVIKPPRAAFFAKRCYAMKVDPSGMRIFGSNSKTISFGDIRLVSLFRKAIRKSTPVPLLIFFVRDLTPPFIVGIENIDFRDFPEARRTSAVESSRNFLAALIDRNPSICMDRPTYAFLNGGELPLHWHEADTWSTSLGEKLESLKNGPDQVQDRLENHTGILYGVMRSVFEITIQDACVEEDCRQTQEETNTHEVEESRDLQGVELTRDDLEMIFLLKASKDKKSLFEKNTPAFWFYLSANMLFIVIVAVLIVVAYLVVPHTP